ncbi:MAG TPA: GNAT family N-acetyltransferase [Actinomycetota bacterium]|nr:GNAT family N-acetyltransferase [Actinomycetota bacterium]
MEPEIVLLKPHQALAGAAVLAASHTDYPAFLCIYPDDRKRAKALLPFFGAAVKDGIRSGLVYGAVRDDEILGIAVWLPPGAFPWSSMRKLRATGAFLRVWAADPANFATFTRVGANSELHHPPGRHWSLEALGIRPEAQRQGLGTRLVTPILERADAEGVECYLETSNPANVAYYQRFGFEVLRDVPLIPDGPPHISMRRPVGARD